MCWALRGRPSERSKRERGDGDVTVMWESVEDVEGAGLWYEEDVIWNRKKTERKCYQVRVLKNLGV